MHLDTHAAIWLYVGDTARFPVAARRRIESEPLEISPMVGLELTVLHEIGRIAGPAEVVLPALADDFGVSVSLTPFAAVVRAATALTWTRDPFDRLICAHAIADDALLLTRDRLIREHLDRARWDEDPE